MMRAALSPSTAPTATRPGGLPPSNSLSPRSLRWGRVTAGPNLIDVLAVVDGGTVFVVPSREKNFKEAITRFREEI